MELLNDMALFVEVVKAGGYRRASEVVGLTISTVSRRVTRLEKTIGLRLLHRITRKIELTEAGRIYFGRTPKLATGCTPPGRPAPASVRVPQPHCPIWIAARAKGVDPPSLPGLPRSQNVDAASGR